MVVPPCVLRHLTDKLNDGFRLYNFSPCVQALKHKHPSETHGGEGGKSRNGNLLQTRHNEPQVTLSHVVGLGVPAPNCAGGFYLVWLQ